MSRLTDDVRRAFVRDGYIVLPGVVPSSYVDAALRPINAALGEGIPGAELESARQRSYCQELRAAPPVLDIFNHTACMAAAQELVGPLDDVTSAQIALRFPTADIGAERRQPSPHLDGMHAPNNGVPFGQILNFTLLAGILLSDLPAPWSGNFTVWPGTHWAYETYFREHGPQSLLDGMPPIDLPEPVHVCAPAGSVVLAHYQLAHTAAPNHSPHIRYALFYRLTARGHENWKWEAMTDIWREWDGVRDMARMVREP